MLNLENEIKELGMSTDKFAKKFDMTPAVFKEKLTGKKLFTREEANLIASYFSDCFV